MEILYLLVPLSVILVFVIAAAFWWSLRSGQYDDLDGPAHSILFDDQDPRHQAAVKPDDTPGNADKDLPPRA